jgi:hypothetical protein
MQRYHAISAQSSRSEDGDAAAFRRLGPQAGHFRWIDTPRRPRHVRDSYAVANGASFIRSPDRRAPVLCRVS